MHEAVRFFTERFEKAGKPERAEFERAYMKSALSFHGVDQKTIRRAAAEYCKARPELSRAELRAAADALYATPWFDLHSAAIAVLERKVKLLEPADADWLVGLVRASACWAHVDWLAVKVLGALVTREPKLLARLPAWGRDRDFWVQRTAMLAQLDELRAGKGDFELFARIASPLVGEKEFFIRKVIGWILREVSRKRPELTRRFLRDHEGKLAGLTYREASKHL